MASSNIVVATGGSNKEAEIILPPPSALNPVPALSAALRVDNEEQLLHLLRQDPRDQHHHNNDPMTIPASRSGLSTDSQANNNSPPLLRQVLVFGTNSLRTLLMRQILSDPHDTQKKKKTSSGGSKKKQKKENWDHRYTFPLPTKTGLNIVATRVLQSSASGGAVGRDGPSPTLQHTTTMTTNSNQAAADEQQPSWSDLMDDKTIDVVTYFIRPSDLHQTQHAATLVKSWSKHNLRTQHRLAYLPQPTTMIHKVLTSLGLTAMSPQVTIQQCPIDVVPIETDVLSFEYDDALRDSDVEGTPSALVTTVARALLKLQDVVGRVPRIQSFGPLGEEVVRKLLAMTVEEYSAASQHQQDRPDDDDAAAAAVLTPPGSGGGSPPAGAAGSTDNSMLTNVVSSQDSDVAALIVIDRKVDMVTPMVTPLTYEGLLDDLVGIDCGFLDVDVNIINPEDEIDHEDGQSSSPDRKKAATRDTNKNEIVSLAVNGSDSLYAEVRDQHVEKFGSFLQNQAIAMKESHANFKREGKKKDLAEIHQFVKQIPIFTQNLRTLTNHIHLAELVKKTSEEATFRERWQLERSMVEGEICYEALEDLVASQYPADRFLRLLCLQSLCSGGIKSSRYDAFRRDVVQTYGYEYLFVLNHLEKVGLLRRREGLWMDTASPFNTLRKSLILINADVDTVEPDDVSYVSSGYAPLSVRLIQTTIKGWKMGQREDILKELPGRFVNVMQRYPPEDLATTLKHTPYNSILDPLMAGLDSAGGGNSSSNRKPVLMVMYVGGITYMELAALRFLSKRPKFPFHIICCTTRIINGSTMLGALS